MVGFQSSFVLDRKEGGTESFPSEWCCSLVGAQSLETGVNEEEP
jgi:hypothetical protein